MQFCRSLVTARKTHVLSFHASPCLSCCLRRRRLATVDNDEFELSTTLARDSTALESCQTWRPEPCSTLDNDLKRTLTDFSRSSPGWSNVQEDRQRLGPGPSLCGCDEQRVLQTCRGRARRHALGMRELQLDGVPVCLDASGRQHRRPKLARMAGCIRTRWPAVALAPPETGAQ